MALTTGQTWFQMCWGHELGDCGDQLRKSQIMLNFQIKEKSSKRKILKHPLKIIKESDSRLRANVENIRSIIGDVRASLTWHISWENSTPMQIFCTVSWVGSLTVLQPGPLLFLSSIHLTADCSLAQVSCHDPSLRLFPNLSYVDTMCTTNVGGGAH